MTTFSCAVNRLNIGESTCTKGVLENPNRIMIADENFVFTSAQADDVSFWTTAIKDKSVVLFPGIFNFEAAPTEAAYEETSFGSRKASQGKYGFRLMYAENIEVYKNLVSFDGSLDRIILFDDQGKMMSTLIGGVQDPVTDNEYGGLTPQMFSVENQTIADGETTKSPIFIKFEDPTEWNTNGFIFIQTFLSQVKSLSTATLFELGTASATLITVTVTNNNDGSPRRALVKEDFSYTGGTISSLTELPAGEYALVGTGLTTGDLDLVVPTSSTQFVESAGSISITVT
ncbi:MAG: hypothetical protein IID16_01060 [Candidatus Marinimicrobia bacterium]|nr:hypothetical protein [Candidatus Neomarinimicrobiota bacterium]